jgi:hypothetical protein
VTVLDLREDTGTVWYHNLAALNGALGSLFSAAKSLSAAASLSFTSTQTVFDGGRIGVIWGKDLVTLNAMFTNLFTGFAAVGTAVSVALGLSQVQIDPHDNGGVLWHANLQAVETNLEALIAGVPTLAAKLSFSIAPGTAALGLAPTAPTRSP